MSFKEELLVYFRMAALFARMIYIPGNVESSQNLSRFIFSGLRCKNVFVYKGGKFSLKNGSKGLKLAGGVLAKK